MPCASTARKWHDGAHPSLKIHSIITAAQGKHWVTPAKCSAVHPALTALTPITKEKSHFLTYFFTFPSGKKNKKKPKKAKTILGLRQFVTHTRMQLLNGWTLMCVLVVSGQWKQCSDRLMKIEMSAPRRHTLKRVSLFHEIGSLAPPRSHLCISTAYRKTARRKIEKKKKPIRLIKQ